MKAKYKRGTAILAMGEVTGHRHQIAECLFKQNEKGLASELILEKESELVHDEHEAILLPEGDVIVVLQRELDLLGEVKQVMD